MATKVSLQQIVLNLEVRNKNLEKLLDQAKADCQAFINQCDREGIGMATVTEHRKRVEKFFKQLEGTPQ